LNNNILNLKNQEQQEINDSKEKDQRMKIKVNESDFSKLLGKNRQLQNQNLKNNLNLNKILKR